MKQVEQLLKKHDEVYRHSCNVRDLATKFAFFLGYSYQEAMRIRLGAFIHDVGKSFINDKILLKDEKLTNEEFEHIKTHSEVGYQYIQDEFKSIGDDLLSIVHQHHERIDGTGYPLGLKGDEIHPYAKIVALCDVYDAITSKRSYKVAYSSNYAFYAIEEGLGSQFCEELGEKFLMFMKNDNDSANYHKRAFSM